MDKEEKLKETKEVVKEVETSKVEVETKSMQETISMLVVQVENLTKKIASLEVENMELQKKLEQTQTKVEQIEQAQVCSNQTNIEQAQVCSNQTNIEQTKNLGDLNIHGFKIRCKETKTKKHTYKKFYAVGYGKIIYIGEDVTKAKEKIQTWIDKNDFVLKLK